MIVVTKLPDSSLCYFSFKLTCYKICYSNSNFWFICSCEKKPVKCPPSLTDKKLKILTINYQKKQSITIFPRLVRDEQL
jgi:hypothetical protein